MREQANRLMHRLVLLHRNPAAPDRDRAFAELKRIKRNVSLVRSDDVRAIREMQEILSQEDSDLRLNDGL